MKRFWQGLAIVLALAGIVMFAWWRIDVWRLKNARDNANTEFERLKDYAVTRQVEYREEIEIKDFYIGNLERELDIKLGEINTAMRVIATYKGITSEGTAVPDKDVPPEMLYIKFTIDDPVFTGWFDSHGGYRIKQRPMEFWLVLFRDENGKWAAVVDAKKMAEQYGITEEEAADLFRLENLEVQEKDPTPRWYENISVGASAGYTDTIAGKVGVGYGIFRLELGADLDGDRSIYFGCWVNPF